MKKSFIAELVLCAILLLTCVTVCYRKSTKTTEAGTFGNASFSNDTFEDLSKNLFGELFL